MAENALVLVQLATRIPLELRRAIKVHCVSNEISLMNFVVQALTEKLARETPRRARRRG